MSSIFSKAAGISDDSRVLTHCASLIGRIVGGVAVKKEVVYYLYFCVWVHERCGSFASLYI